MSKSVYNYGSSYGANAASSLYSYRDRVAAAAAAYPYVSDDGTTAAANGRLPSVEPYNPAGDSSFFSDRGTLYFPSSTGSFYGSSAYEPSATAGVKRSVEALYHQSLLGSNNNFGQSEDFISSNSLIKRTKQDIGSNLPIYPQRPGAKDCAYYMMTRTCKFGEACKFDHPIWVPQYGIPDWKEVPLIPTGESLPERLGEPDCPYYMKTQKCKFGARCKFNHPMDKLNAYTVETGVESQEIGASDALPERPSEPVCSFYMKTGTCKFGASCKFNHPKDIQILGKGQDTSKGDPGAVMDNSLPCETSKMKSFVPFTPALIHNSKGLPVRPGETDCPFYLKTGSCKYGPTCRYNHPERHSINPPLAADLGQALVPSPATSLHIAGLLNPAASFLQNIELQSAQASLGLVPTVYPQRPGEIECDFYMKTGQCKFGERCRFHHPIDRSGQSAVTKQASQLTVKLTLAGLPRREGATVCSFYMKTGTCKFGATCKFDHPPPGEAIAMATNQETGSGGDGAEAPMTTEKGGENIET